MKLIDPISAIVPWYSYDYQGHIALYVSLKKLHELIVKGDKIQLWKLQIEGEEDFSLINDGKYVSLHQVKAGKVKLEPLDKFCFMTALVEDDKAYGYLHITSKGGTPRDFYKNAIDQSDELIKKLKQDVIEEKNLKKGESKDKKIIFENIKSSLKKGDCYCILRYVLEETYGSGKYTIKNVQDKIPDIISTIEENKKYFTEKVDEAKSKNPSVKADQVFIDVYPERFETIKDIREKAIELIKKILGLKKPEYDFVDEAYSLNVYMKLFDYMKEVMNRHVDAKKIKDKCIISFEKILEVISKNYTEESITEKYQYYQVIRSISDSYARYPEKFKIKCKVEFCNECTDKDDCNLRKQIKLLMDKKVEEREKTVQNLILCRPEKGKSNNLPSDNLVSNHLLDILHDVKTMELSDRNVFRAMNDAREIYQIILEDSYNADELLARIHNFSRNPANIEILYEPKVLITDRIDNEKLVLGNHNITNMGKDNMRDLAGKVVSPDTVEKMDSNYTKTNVIRLVNKKTAIGELK